MSKKMLGGFSQFMSAATKEAAAAEAEATAKDTILNIDVDNLVPDPNNKYGMRDIDLLASMMEANQFHVETLEVRDIGEGKYMIVAGHRRCAAWKKLLESGVTEKRTLPCIVRKFSDVVITYSDDDSEQKTETMSGDYMAKVSLILSNLGQRKDKTLEEQIWEIKELEPYARALYASMKQKKEYKGAFRNFFAQEVLELSPVVLQRKLNLSRLSQKAQDALYKDKIISETAAVELSGMSEEEQDAYIDELRAGTATGKVQEVHDLKTGKSSDLQSEDDTDYVINSDGKMIKTITLEGLPEGAGFDVQVYITKSDREYYGSYSYENYGATDGDSYRFVNVNQPYNTEDEAFQAALLKLAEDHPSVCDAIQKAGYNLNPEFEDETDADDDREINGEGKPVKTIELAGFPKSSDLAAQVHIVESDGKYYSSYSYEDGPSGGGSYPNSSDTPYNTEGEAFQVAVQDLCDQHPKFYEAVTKAGYRVQSPATAEDTPEPEKQPEKTSIPFGNPLESVNSAPIQPAAAPAPASHGVVIPSIPVPNDGNVENANKEAHEWFENSMATIFNGLMEEAKHEQEAAQQAGSEAVAAQWGIRVAIANYRIVKLKEFVSKED